jgi:putative transposase
MDGYRTIASLAEVRTIRLSISAASSASTVGKVLRLKIASGRFLAGAMPDNSDYDSQIDVVDCLVRRREVRFIARHQGTGLADWLCEALGVSRGGFYAWLTQPRSQRSRHDEELGAKVRASFVASDRTYGARRVWRDLLTEGIACGLHRVERLMRLQALKARPRRRRLPPDLGERQVAAVAPNVLDRTFEATAPNRKWIADFTYVWTAEGWLYVAAVIDLFSRRVVGWSMSAGMTTRHRRPGDGDLAARQTRCAVASLRSRQPVHQRTVPAVDGRQRRHLLDEPIGQRLGQRSNGELLLVAEDRAHRPQNLPDARPSQSGCVRLHRALLQSQTQALDDRVPEPYGVRATGWISLSGYLRNRGRPH